MKVKLLDLVASLEALSKLKSLKINAQLSFEIALISRSVSEYISSYYKIRDEKIKEFGEKMDDGTFSIDHTMGERWNNFIKEINLLLDKDCDIGYDKIKLSDLKKSDGSMIDIEPEVLESLHWLIKDK